MAAAGTITGETHGFPRVRTSLVGRDDDITEVAGLLARHQLVTVTGPGGVGKTRLAFEVAQRAAAGFAGGAWLVELAAITDPARVPDAVAARKQLLLVLDNCEHLLPGVAEFCERLLAVADDVRVLATSREPIGLPDEVRYRLPPLAVPSPGEGAGPNGSAAAALFTERARQADPRLDLSGDAAPQVARLVARLDGMPLAIELAAARIEALGLTQLRPGGRGGRPVLHDGGRLARGQRPGSRGLGAPGRASRPGKLRAPGKG